MVVLGAKICSEDLVAGYMRKIPHLEEFPRIYFIFMVEFLYIHSILAVKGGGSSGDVPLFYIRRN